MMNVDLTLEELNDEVLVVTKPLLPPLLTLEPYQTPPGVPHGSLPQPGSSVQVCGHQVVHHGAPGGGRGAW